MTRRKIMWLIVLLVSGWLLAACAGSTSTPTTPTPVSSIVANGPATPHDLAPTDSVALAYDPTDQSLLKGDRAGLFRWHAGGQWTSINVPQTFGVSGVIVNPDHPATIYASGPGLGVVRSDDDGRNWRPVNTGLPNLDVSALALHSFRRETLYAWLKGDGIYRTEDGGANWKRMPDQGPPDKDVRGLTHSTLEGSMNTGWLYAATPVGAYLSMDCF